MKLPALMTLLLVATISGCGWPGGPETSRRVEVGSPPTVPSGATPAGSCGETGKPDCPLQGWMKATLKPYLTGATGPDLGRLQTALEKLAVAAPVGYPDWSAIARRGAASARAGDEAAVGQSCLDCHTSYRKRYRSEVRTPPTVSPIMGSGGRVR